MSENSQNLKVLLQKFLDCKSETAIISEKALKLRSVEAYEHVIGEQEACLKVIRELSESTHPSLSKYMEGINASKTRIAAEQKFLRNVLDNKTEALSTTSMAIGLVSDQENMIWASIEQKAKAEPTWFISSVGAPMLFGWGFFITIAILLILKGRIGINSESVKLYFDEQRDKFFKFLLKMLDSDKK